MPGAGLRSGSGVCLRAWSAPPPKRPLALHGCAEASRHSELPGQGGAAPMDRTARGGGQTLQGWEGAMNIFHVLLIRFVALGAAAAEEGRLLQHIALRVSLEDGRDMPRSKNRQSFSFIGWGRFSLRVNVAECCETIESRPWSEAARVVEAPTSSTTLWHIQNLSGPAVVLGLGCRAVPLQRC